MVKQWFTLLLPSARGAYDVDDWHVLSEGYEESGDGDGTNSTNKLHTTSYSINSTEFADAKAEGHSKYLHTWRDSVMHTW